MSAAADFQTAYMAKRSKSMEWFERASRVLAGKVGHDLRHFEPVPLYIARGKAGRKWDVDGNEYIDFLMGNGALLLGHAPPAVVETIRQAVGQGTHFGSDHPLHLEWAELVQQLVPSAERVRFVNSGSEATLLALRLARAYTGRNKILRFQGHFHGWHDDAVHGFQPPFEADGSLGVLPQVRDNMVLISDGDLKLVEDVLSRETDVAAVILEPSGASWGRVPLEGDFVRGLQKITARHGVVLICDEVITGFRFSPGGAQQLYDLRPDLSCFAKVLAGGMPGGAVVGRAEIMKLFDLTGEPQHDRYERVTHLGTFNAAPLSAAAGVAVLRQVAAGGPIDRANAVAKKLRVGWDAVLERHGIAGYVYGPSSIFHVYFETDPERVRGISERWDLYTREASWLKGMPPRLIAEYQQRLRHHGVDVMSFTGGFVSAAHTESDIDEATAAFEQTVIGLRDQRLIQTL